MMGRTFWALHLLFLLVAAAVSQGCAQPTAARTLPRLEVTPVPAYYAPLRETVAPGDTLESVSRRLTGGDWVAWRDALADAMDPRSLRPGLVFDARVAPSGRVSSITIALDRRVELHFVAESDDIRFERIERPVEHTVARFEGEVVSSLFGAVETAGGRPELAIRLAEIFQWDIDFFRDLRQGDRFIVLVDRQLVDGRFYAYGTIFGARFVNGGRILDAYAYRGPDGRLGYYDPDGAPLRKQFLRAPLEFRRISSGFNLNRMHPVHHRRMPHYGVDYAAPTGTPVLATADGVVDFVGRNGGAGKMVRLRHPNSYQTNYLHLSGYARGIRRGARVQQGQVVGYVGSTGWSTGPHLDYRVKHNGRWINPLKLASPAAKPLPDTLLPRYLRHAESMTTVLEGGRTPVGAAS
jgi:murein DD-endopeptidase MepM/ murein hydrolase activator NlpD